MKVLWTHNFNPDVPNAGVFMYTAADALAAHGLEPELLYLGNLRAPSALLKAARRVREYAREFDVVHSQFGSAAALATAAAVGPVKVVTLRGSDWNPAVADRLAMKFHAATATGMTRLALPHFDMIVSVSNRIARQVRQRWPSAQVIVLPSPIDLRQFSPRSKANSRRELGLPTDGVSYVLFTALNSSAPHKRRELAEAAIEVARREHPDLRILVATDRSHAEMPLVVSAADVAVCTSTSEGWPNSIKEALACNVPFVATDVSDLKEIADVDSSCMVAEPEPEALGLAISRVLQRRNSATDLRHHVEHMAPDVFAAELISAYGQLLEKRATRD